MASQDGTTLEEFFNHHCSMPGGVILVITDHPDLPGEVATSIFSSVERAKDYARGKANQGLRFEFRPQIIDGPDSSESLSRKSH
jgi:hypothetical protein